MQLPATAAWRHLGARDGFEVLFISAHGDGWAFEGHTTAVEESVPWAVSYRIELDGRSHTRRARISGRSPAGERVTEIAADGAGHWTADGVARPELDGCLDLDLESSALTNAFPVHRLAVAPGAAARADAAYVRAVDLGLERLEQHYARPGLNERYDYHAPAFDFRCALVYDGAGLVVDYPGIAARVA